MASKTIHCAAVDLGATSGRVIVGTWAKNRLTLTEVHRFPNGFRSVGGHDYWDIPGLWTEIATGLRLAKKRFPQLASVGVDTWGVDHVLVNDAGRMVFPTHAYRDARTQPGLTRLANTRAALERIYAATGIPNVFYNSSLQLEETVAHNPAVADLATRCLFLPDYFNFLLSGRMENEISFASTSQLLAVHGRDWSRATLDHFHIPATWFTPPILANTVLGPILPEVGRVLRTSRESAKSGAKRGSSGRRALPDIKVVAVPGHDTACAYDAMPANPTGGDLYISSGTWSLVGFESDTPLLGHEALTARISNERTGDGRYRPLTNVIGLWLLEQTLKDFTARPKNDAEWVKLINASSKLTALSFKLDCTDPAFVNPSSMRAAIDAQLKRRKLPRPKNLAGYVRLICDSLGQGHADALRAFEKLAGRKFQRILIVGGGSKNRLLCQATADASGLPVHAFTLEGTAVGNIASQLVALRAVRNLKSFREHFAKQIKATVYQPG
ncbi:rhamnulokinase family protein [Opitutus sp. GAS368]|uniref:rhamnulokinase n=1 Tax=Opitutus sp. GAS368 TaxID=1882749 RepID=UPI00087D9EE9|nr:rhamnulokinase family protein [Opitutus sp. GAS368]SDS36297.1 L-rhamnulokinase [Opitutus sp. GAS368]